MKIIVTTAVDVKLSSSSTSSLVAYQDEDIHAIFHSQVSHIQAYTFLQERLSSLLCTTKTLMHTLHHDLTLCVTLIVYQIYTFTNSSEPGFLTRLAS